MQNIIRIHKILCAGLLFILWGISTNAQSSNDKIDTQIWTDFTFTHILNNRISYEGDGGVRISVDDKNWTLIYLRPTAHFNLTSIVKLSGGIGSFNTFNDIINNIYELRIFQDVQIIWPDFGWVDFYHRIRFEERFFFYERLDSDISIRARYLIRARSNNFKFIGKKKSWNIKSMWEAFVPIGSGSTEFFVNNHRWYFAIGYQPSNTNRYELFYIWQRSHRFSEDGLKTSQNIIRFRIFYSLRKNK